MYLKGYYDKFSSTVKILNQNKNISKDIFVTENSFDGFIHRHL